MVYVDTSALVPLFIREPKSEAVIGWLESGSEHLAISEWTLVEFASAAAIKVRTGQIAPSFAKRATARVREFVQRHCLIALPGRDEFHRAAEWTGDDVLKLRAGDALHLAIAINLRVQGILCLDKTMIESARTLELNVVEL